MDVRCGRCGTEYDFDDALVSERGTTVKCTNCGHQFKVYPGGGGGGPERWIVRKSSGRELVYTSLRDLQRAIAQRQVGTTDLLSRGDQPVRPLGSIAELEPFFNAQAPAPAEVSRTLLGVAPGTEPPAPAAATPPPVKRSKAPPPPVRGGTAGGGYGAPAPAPQRVVAAAPPTPEPTRQELEETTVPRNDAPPPPPRAVEPPTEPSALEDELRVLDDDMARAFRAPEDSFHDDSFHGYPQRRRSSSALRWIVGIVIASGVAFVGGTLGVRYVRQLSSKETTAAKAPQDDRVKKLLERGDEDLSRGDFESAKEQFDKASVLAERDPAVLAALARLEATRADIHWLALKAADRADATAQETEKAALERRLARVQRAADDAAAVSPDDPTVLRARVDALRLAGDLGRARTLVTSLTADSSQPETAYVLAALDLAEPTPAWPAVIERLRTAASAERGPGRARAALVYALASAGEVDQARAELAKLEPGPSAELVRALKALVGRAAPAAPEGSADGRSPAPPPTTPVAAGDTAPRAPDFRRLLEDASAAKRSGDLGRAESLYRAAQDQQPGNIEAIAGLGDVARARGDSATAGAYYDSALRQNPTYLPALIAAADLKWSSGDKAAAVALYKRVTNQVGPDSPYGQRAAQRVAESQGGSGSAATSPEKVELREDEPPARPAPPAPRAPADTPPEIDTSDLPGFSQ